MKVKIIGVGGIGNAVLPVLAHFMYYDDQSKYRLYLIDGDSYKIENLPRQKFLSIGNKAEVKVSELQAEYPALQLKAYGEFVEPDTIDYLIEDGDIVLLCVDNHKTRSFVSQYCAELDNIILISGGNDFTDGNIQVQVCKNGKALTLPLANCYHPEIENPTDRSPHEIGCDEEVISKPQLIFTNNFIAAMMLNAFYNFACLENQPRYDEVYADIITNNTRAVDRLKRSS
jgi:molybdopterin/thiamine biosynthesis adenylyltransferase